jgi:hypothetical protein
MDSEDTSHYKSRPALEALKLQAEEHLAKFAPPDEHRPARSAQRDDIAPDQTEYKSKESVRNLGLIFKADQAEI